MGVLWDRRPEAVVASPRAVPRALPALAQRPFLAEGLLLLSCDSCLSYPSLPQV